MSFGRLDPILEIRVETMDPLFKDFLVALGAQEEPFANRTKNVIFDGSTHLYYGFFYSRRV